MEKILEIKGLDWMKGYSTQPYLAINGLFILITSFDPFEAMGMLQPSLAATELTAPVTNPIMVITSWVNTSTNVGYFYGHTRTKLYSYLVNSPYTQADVTAEINVTQNIAGAIVWRGKYIYAQYGAGSSVYANALPVASGSNVQILASRNSLVNDVSKFCIGADKNLYCGDVNGVCKFTSATGTSGNNVDGFVIDTGFTVRDLINDGRYLVIIADNNGIESSTRVQGDYLGKIYFWDMIKGTADVIWDIKDSYLIGGGFLDGKIYVFGYNGIYVCNLVTAPKMIWDFRGNSTITKRPGSPYQISVGSQDIYWADGGTTGQNIFAIREQVVYSPYQTHGSTDRHTAISAIGNVLVAATDAPKIYMHNVGTTRANATVKTANMPLVRPYSYGYTVVVLKSPLSSGQAVDLNVFNSNDSIISTTATKSYSVDGALKMMVFSPAAVAGMVTQFDDIALYLNPQGGAVIERVSVYGTPSEDFLQA